MISLNDRAAVIVDRMVEDAEALALQVHQLASGATVVDAGVEVPGSLEAGRLFAEVCLGGLGDVRLCEVRLDALVLPGVEVDVRQPVLACMASQYAGWAIDVPRSESTPGYFAMGSGPARALYCGEQLFEDLGYKDTASRAVLTLESRQLPTDEAVAWVAKKCGVPAGSLLLLVAPTASLVGSVQIAARIVETGLHKMHEVGFDIGTVRSGFGVCPMAPVARDDLSAIGRTNDAVLYGGRSWYTVQAEDDAIASVIDRLPAAASRDHGVPFKELFERYGGDFYKIDPLLFSPAEVFLTSSLSGRTVQAGVVDADLLERSLLS